jgi:fluoride exporter
VPSTRRLYGAVMLGSAVGAASRYLLSLAALHLPAPVFPWGTLTANVTGSLLIGFYATLIEPDGRVMVSPAARQFVMVGLLGGFTTFSIFSLETLLLWQEAAYLAATYIAVSLVAWLAAGWAGFALAARLVSSRAGA